MSKVRFRVVLETSQPDSEEVLDIAEIGAYEAALTAAFVLGEDVKFVVRTGVRTVDERGPRVSVDVARLLLSDDFDPESDETVTDETVTDETVTDETVTDETVTDEPVTEGREEDI